MPFVNVFEESLELFCKALQGDQDTQPFVVVGSGTLRWHMLASNLCEKGDDALVLHTGYAKLASSWWPDTLQTLSQNASKFMGQIQLKAPIGSHPSLSEIDDALKSRNYKIITITHMDISTGILSDIKAIAELTYRISPSTLVVVDGVCSVGCEEIEFSNWGIDVVLIGLKRLSEYHQVLHYYLHLPVLWKSSMNIKVQKYLILRHGRTGFPLCKPMKVGNQCTLRLPQYAHLRSKYCSEINTRKTFGCSICRLQGSQYHGQRFCEEKTWPQNDT